MSSNIMSKDFSLYFILPSRCEDELSTSTDMQEAFEAYRQNHLNPEWIRECDILDESLNKNDIVTIEKFEGKTFEELSKRKSLLVGPRCLLTCLLNNVPVPSNGGPVFNIAMVNLKISITNIPLDKKAQLQKKIEYMGGVFSPHITSNCTHLVSCGTRSKKYNMAVINQIPILLESWIEAVWEDNLTKYNRGDEPQYLTTHKCPTFHELIVSSTGFDEHERNEIKLLIEKNGGYFSPRMNIHRTHILLCRSSSCKSDKFLSAMKSNIPCVSKQWLLDSINAGAALVEDNYLIKVSSSTPTKHSRPPDLDMSVMSVISGPNANRGVNNSTLDATTVSFYNRTISSATKIKKNSETIDNDQKILNIDLKQIKMAGAFLDGCSVFLIGFSSAAREKLCRILKLAGATRYDDMSDRVTQVLVGDEKSHELKQLFKKGCSAPVVSIEWLIESIQINQPAGEEKFIVSVKGSPATSGTPASPSVSRGLSLLRANTSTVDKDNKVTRCLQFGAEDNTKDPNAEDIMQHYLSKAKEDDDDTLAKLIADVPFTTTKEQTTVNVNEKTNQSEQSKEASNLDELDSTNPFFKDKTFVLIGFNKEYTEDLTTIIKQRCGRIKSPKYTGIPDYVVVPAFIDELNLTASDIVNHLYIVDCDSANEIIPKKYYHEPIVTNSDSKPLEGFVITASNYVGSERLFVRLLIEQLGAEFQNSLAKSAQGPTTPASTHLVCKTPTGKKYKAAIGWGIPVVDHKWLMCCLQCDAKADENKFFVREGQEEESHNETLIKQHSTLETLHPSKYFPSDSKHTMTKLDISTTKTINRAETPKSDSSFKGIESKSIEKSEKIKKDISNDHDKSDEAHISNDHNFTIPTIRRFSEKDMNKGTPTDRTPKAGTSNNLLDGQNLKENKYASDALVEIEGEKVPLSKFMQNLREQGLFDRGSPAEHYNISPYVVARQAVNAGTPKLNETSETGSQDTPVGKYIRGLQQRNVLPGTSGKAETPDSPLPKAPNDVRTPNTPLGAFLCADNAVPSPNTRKYWQRRIDRLPGPSQETKRAQNRRISTPLSDLKKQTWDWLLRKNKDESFETFNKKRKISEHDHENINTETSEQISETNVSAPQENTEVTNNLKQLQSMLNSNDNTGSGRRGSLYKSDNSTPQRSRFSHLQVNLFPEKDSQPDNVGWADPVDTEDLLANEQPLEPAIPKTKKFMLSSMANDLKQLCEKIITKLGGTVSTSQQFDPTATHLVCLAPSRNEKILSSLASGKFIVHTSYLHNCEKIGSFIDEQPYEFGNPSFLPDIKLDMKPGTTVQQYYWWRKHLEQSKQKAFVGMRVVLIASNHDALRRLIEAGDGVVVNVSPPFDHNIDATHCLIDPKLGGNYSDFVPLARQGIPCVHVIYLSNYLNSMGKVDPKQHIPTELQNYYDH